MLIENLRRKYFKKNNKILNIFKRRQFNVFVNYGNTFTIIVNVLKMIMPDLPSPPPSPNHHEQT